MTSRELTPELRAVAYPRFLRLGLCPNTGGICDSVGALCMALEASEASGQVHEQFDAALADNAACVGDCAIKLDGLE
jgi:hypothetical protein